MVRSKYRYVTVRIALTSKKRDISEVSFRSEDLYSSILSKIQKLHGDFGISTVKTGFLCKYCNAMTGVAILKARHGPHRYVTSVLPFVTQLGKENVQLQTIQMTATLHQAYKYLKIYQSTQLERVWDGVEVESREETMEKYMNLESVEKLLMAEKRVDFKTNIKIQNV